MAAPPVPGARRGGGGGGWREATGRAGGAGARAGSRREPPGAHARASFRFFATILPEPPLPTHAHRVATLPGHIAATLPAREIRVSDPHLAGPGPIDAESDSASIPTFTSASRSRGGSCGEDELCCLPYPSFYTIIRENRVNSYQLKGVVWPGRAGSLGAHTNPHILCGRLTLRVSYTKQPTPYPKLALNLPQIYPKFTLTLPSVWVVSYGKP